MTRVRYISLFCLFWAYVNPSLGCDPELLAQVASESGAHWQVGFRRQYISKLASKVAQSESPYRNTLPGSIPPAHRAAIEAIHALVHHPTDLFDRLQQVEREVVNLASKEGVSYEVAFHALLAREEKKYGFGEVVHVTSYLTKSQFMAYLREGRPVYDEYFKDKPHTMHGHRLMSVIEARLLEERFGDSKLYIEIYKALGDQSYMTKLDWSRSGVDQSLIVPGTPESYPDLWGYLHDNPFMQPEHFSVRYNDFANPEFFSTLRDYFPALREGWK